MPTVEAKERSKVQLVPIAGAMERGEPTVEDLERKSKEMQERADAILRSKRDAKKTRGPTEAAPISGPPLSALLSLPRAPMTCKPKFSASCER